MNNVQKNKIPKTSVRIYSPIVKKLDEKMNAACLRRDAYLNKVLEIELNELDREVSLPNSVAAQSFIAERIGRLDRKLVSLALRPDLVKRLNDICARKRIVRDAFFNRLFLFLTASPKVIDRLLFPGVGGDWRAAVWSEHKHDLPLFDNTFYPLEQDIDPFVTIRTGLRLYNEGVEELYDHTNPATGELIRVAHNLNGDISPRDSFYTSILHDKQIKKIDLYGFNCYIPDWLIPDSPALLDYEKHFDAIFI